MYYVPDPASGEPVSVGVLEWARQFEERCAACQRGEPDPWRIDWTALPSGTEVSTVFLGLDHGWGHEMDAPPVLWESLVFGGPLDQEMNRYTSLAAALTGHTDLVRQVREAEGQVARTN